MGYLLPHLIIDQKSIALGKLLPPLRPSVITLPSQISNDPTNLFSFSRFCTFAHHVWLLGLAATGRNTTSCIAYIEEARPRSRSNAARPFVSICVLPACQSAHHPLTSSNYGNAPSPSLSHTSLSTRSTLDKRFRV